jgi:hypothetical protein
MSNPILDVMSYYGDVLNRKNFIETAYPGKPPSKLDPESEAELPQDDVRFMEHRPTTHEEEKAEEMAKAAKSKK